jgi:hypothetical protein
MDAVFSLDCVMLGDVPFDVECLSLIEESWREACAERWVQSVHAGRDVGPDAIRYWAVRHWPGFIRHRCIQHMLGEKFWLELGRKQFGILEDIPQEMRPILEVVVERLICGDENLGMVVWLCKQPPEQQPCIRYLLCRIDINSYRKPCHFANGTFLTPPTPDHVLS